MTSPSRAPCRDLLAEIVALGVGHHPDDPKSTERGQKLFASAQEAIQSGAGEEACHKLLVSAYAHGKEREAAGLLQPPIVKLLQRLGDFLQSTPCTPCNPSNPLDSVDGGSR